MSRNVKQILEPTNVDIGILIRIMTQFVDCILFVSIGTVIQYPPN